ncbi:MAG: AI-2E family transporter, partial [Verrucomicrobiota bacterium]
DGVLVSAALWLMGVPYSLLIGVFLAILGLIPFIGSLLVMIPAILIALAHFGATSTGTVEGIDDLTNNQVVTIQMDNGEKIKGPVSEILSNEGGVATVKVLTNAWDWLPHVWAYPLIVLVIFVTLQQINGLVTAPKIVGDSVGLHPLNVIFSVLFWSLLLGGLLGALLAVPLTAAIKVLFKRYIWEKRIEPAIGSPDEDPKESVETEIPSEST